MHRRIRDHNRLRQIIRVCFDIFLQRIIALDRRCPAQCNIIAAFPEKRRIHARLCAGITDDQYPCSSTRFTLHIILLLPVHRILPIQIVFRKKHAIQRQKEKERKQKQY